MSRTRPFLVSAFFPGRCGNDGGGLCTIAGRFGSLATATKEAERRLRLYECGRAYDRVQVRVRGRHPWWFYLDGDGRLCMWRLRESDRLQAWGYSSS